MDNDNVKTGGISLTGLALLWALVSQCLVWAGVWELPWIAVWGPFLICLGITLVLLLIVLIVFAAMFALNR